MSGIRQQDGIRSRLDDAGRTKDHSERRHPTSDSIASRLKRINGL
jgi:hypothetical protein